MYVKKSISQKSTIMLGKAPILRRLTIITHYVLMRVEVQSIKPC